MAYSVLVTSSCVSCGVDIAAGIDESLVIAHESGIIRSSLGGESTEILVDSTPVGKL